MKKLFLVVFLFGAFVVLRAEDLFRLTRQADSCYMAGDFRGASRLYGEALKCPGACSANYYNAACCAAKAGEKDTAFERLEAEFRLFPDWYSRHLQEDADLLSLHADARWTDFVSRVKARQDSIEAAYEHPLYEHLLQIGQEDQQIRQQYMQAYQDGQSTDSLLREMTRLDTLHMQFVDSLLAARGWVGRRQVGDGTTAIWFVVQHYGMDKWKQYLPLFEKAVQQGDLNQQQLDMLKTRIQLYSKSEGRWTYDATTGRILDNTSPIYWRLTSQPQAEMNASDCSYGARFLPADSLQSYPGRKFIKNLLKDLPFRVDSVCFVYADRYVLLKMNQQAVVEPDYVIQSDSVEFYAKGDVFKAEKQQRADVVWRNIIVKRHKHRVVWVDRFHLGGQYWALVGFLQSRCRQLKRWGIADWCDLPHWDCADKTTFPMMTHSVDYARKVSIDILNNHNLE